MDIYSVENVQKNYIGFEIFYDYDSLNFFKVLIFIPKDYTVLECQAAFTQNYTRQNFVLLPFKIEEYVLTGDMMIQTEQLKSKKKISPIRRKGDISQEELKHKTDLMYRTELSTILDIFGRWLLSPIDDTTFTVEKGAECLIWGKIPDLRNMPIRVLLEDRNLQRIITDYLKRDN